MIRRSPIAHKRLSAFAAVSVTLLAAISALPSPTAALGTVKPKTSLTTIERQVMCVTCKIPLNVAQSQQADRERVFIQRQIAHGDSEAQVKDALVGQYGVTVLGLPRAHGFDLTAYLVPLAAVLALAVTLLTLLPRWRRHARAQAEAALPTSKLSATDAARLDSDLARFD
jgi:cytochrome c-type biogenesis protein CcmH